MRWFCLTCVRAVFVSLLPVFLAACNAPAPGSPPAGQEDVSSVSPLAEDGRGEGYECHIRYPEVPAEWTALNQALHAYALKRKAQFRATLAPDAERAGEPPAALDLEFDVARRTQDFVSVLARESVHSKGAQTSTATVASFVLHFGDDKLLSIVDLFKTPDGALQALSDESRRQLLGRYEASLRQNSTDATALAQQLKRMQAGVERGTAPAAANFAVFLIDGIDSRAIGLTLIFAPAQLDAASEGEQQVEVPAKVFDAQLKPEYRDAFLDTQAVQPEGR
jgi:hypothetical protein